MVTVTLTTVDDMTDLPEGPERYDLIEGELFRMSPAADRHGEIAMTIGFHLRNYVVPNRLGTVWASETGFILRREPDTLLAPDVSFVATGRRPPVDQRVGFVNVVPDLVVEVVSPSDRRRYVSAKVTAYLDAGVRLVWVVEPRTRTVTVHASGQPERVVDEDGTLDGGDVLPDFTLAVAEVFVETG
ncbi:MAG: Uma2 family endonuclease [Chloroflexia bacterium]|nr:Uma2 family endonuclease [Chloroflexia bacterium]